MQVLLQNDRPGKQTHPINDFLTPPNGMFLSRLRQSIRWIARLRRMAAEHSSTPSTRCPIAPHGPTTSFHGCRYQEAQPTACLLRGGVFPRTTQIKDHAMNLREELELLIRAVTRSLTSFPTRRRGPGAQWPKSPMNAARNIQMDRAEHRRQPVRPTISIRFRALPGGRTAWHWWAGSSNRMFRWSAGRRGDQVPGDRRRQVGGRI